MDFVAHNREAWKREVENDNPWTQPVDQEVIEKARLGDWRVLLTPTKPVPRAWFPELEGIELLCLACGGGQQGPVFAAAGAKVTVFDNCPAQLEKDREVAQREGLQIRLEQGDMRDLSRFPDESFSMIFHPVSNCFVDNVLPVWKESYRVLKNGGVLLAGFCNPVTFIFDMKEWDEHKNLVVRYKIPYADLEQLPKEELEARIKAKETLEFGHTLEDQIGGQVAAGFSIRGFFEDTAGGDLLDPYLLTFIATKAIK